VKFGKKPLKDFLVNRHNKVQEKIDEAAQLMTEAEAMKREYEARLSKLDAEIEAFKAKVMEETKSESEKVLSEARAFAAENVLTGGLGGGDSHAFGLAVAEEEDALGASGFGGCGCGFFGHCGVPLK